VWHGTWILRSTSDKLPKAIAVHNWHRQVTRDNQILYNWLAEQLLMDWCAMCLQKSDSKPQNSQDRDRNQDTEKCLKTVLKRDNVLRLNIRDFDDRDPSSNNDQGVQVFYNLQLIVHVTNDVTVKPSHHKHKSYSSNARRFPQSKNRLRSAVRVVNCPKI